MNWLSTLWSLIQPVRTPARPRLAIDDPTPDEPSFVRGGYVPPIRPMDLTDDERAEFEGGLRQARECKCCAEFRVVEFGLRVQIADMAAQNARLRQEVAARDWLADPVHRAAYEAARRAVEEVDRGD